MKRIICLISSLILLTVTMAYAQDKNGAIISAEKTDFDFGMIKEVNGKVSHTFVIDNVGKKPLVITRVVSACGCTTSEYTVEPIPAGGRGTITVTFNPEGRPGPFVKTIAVYSNGKDGSFTFRIKGVVE